MDSPDGDKCAHDAREASPLSASPGSEPSPAEPAPPAFLRRLMDDYARQLRLAQGECADSEQKNGHAGPTSVLDRAGASYSYSTSSASSMTDVSPRSFSHYAGSTSSMSSVGSSAVYAASPTLLTLPRATLDEPAVATAHPHTSSKTGSSTPVYTPAQRLENVYSLPKEVALDEPLLPPQNFAIVSSFVYRSSFPTRKNFPFLRSLGLKSVLCVPGPSFW